MTLDEIQKELAVIGTRLNVIANSLRDEHDSFAEKHVVKAYNRVMRACDKCVEKLSESLRKGKRHE